MTMSSRFARAVRWVFLVAAAGVLPASVMRCDKAALNFQRGLYQGLGLNVSEVLVDEGLIDLEGLMVQP
jgi:hypothetical protein